MTEKKKELSEFLVKAGIIKSNTEQVILNCNAGHVCDYKTVERFK